MRTPKVKSDSGGIIVWLFIGKPKEASHGDQPKEDTPMAPVRPFNEKNYPKVTGMRDSSRYFNKNPFCTRHMGVSFFRGDKFGLI